LLAARTCQDLARRKEEQVRRVVACTGTVDAYLVDSSEEEAHKVLVLLAVGARVGLQFGG
jgi:hypothetical protein